MLHGMKSPIVYSSSKKADFYFLDKEHDEPSTYRSCCNYFFNLLKESLFPLPLKPEAPSICHITILRRLFLLPLQQCYKEEHT